MFSSGSQANLLSVQTEEKYVVKSHGDSSKI